MEKERERIELEKQKEAARLKEIEREQQLQRERERQRQKEKEEEMRRLAEIKLKSQVLFFKIDFSKLKFFSKVNESKSLILLNLTFSF